MSDHEMPKIEQLEDFLRLLEIERLNLVEAVANSESDYDLNDLEKLAIHGSAIQSVKDAIEFRKRFDGA
jgi:hypothetical protein